MRSETAVYANRRAQIAVERTGWRPLQCISNQVSGQSLSKTGIFADAAGDFRRLAPQNQGIGSLETKSNARKAGISGPISRFFESLAGRRNAWLGREDSNHDILSLQTPFEMSGEFRPISWKCRAGDFRNYLSRIWERQRPDKLLACFGPVSGRPDVSREVGQGPYANVRFGSPCLRAGLES